jgi:O-antigen/teichoic acid export membrane protein
MILPSDKLITYAALLSFISAGVTLFYIIYNNRNFILCRITRTINKDQFRKILSFSGWNLLGSVAVLVTYQGINFILNYFYGVAVNAALAIANQVYAATTSFTGSFQTAFRPQITKNYAKGNFNDFFDLVFRTTKYSFFLVIVCAIPLFFQCYGILHLWLGIVPEYTLEFCRYLIMVCVIDALAAPLAMSANATGKIKTYQIIISSILILNFPFSLLLMNLGLSPVWALIVRFIVCCIAFIYRIIYMVRVLNMNLVLYIQKTILPCLFVLVPSIIMVLFAYYNLHLHTVLMAAISLILTATVIFFLGLNKTERTLIKLTLKSKLKL